MCPKYAQKSRQYKPYNISDQHWSATFLQSHSPYEFFPFSSTIARQLGVGRLSNSKGRIIEEDASQQRCKKHIKTSTNKLNHMHGKQQFPTKPSAKTNELYASRLGKLDDLTTQRDSMIPNGCGYFFSVWGTFPCILLHFGAKFFYSIFPWCYSIFPWLYSIFPWLYSIVPWFYSIVPWFYLIFPWFY